MSDALRNLIKEERWKRWHEASNLHVLGEAELASTRVIRNNAGKTIVDPDTDPTKITKKSVSGRRPINPEDFKEPEQGTVKSTFVDSEGDLTDLGKGALKANTVWTGQLAQLLNFQAGKQLAQQLGAKLAAKTDLDAGIGEKIAEAIMKQVLEHLDEMASADMEQTFPGVLDRTRG